MFFIKRIKNAFKKDNVLLLCVYLGIRFVCEIRLCAHARYARTSCVLSFLGDEVICDYYGMRKNTTRAHNRRLCVFKCYDHLLLLRYERKIPRTRTTQDCVFLNVTITYRYYGMR